MEVKIFKISFLLSKVFVYLIASILLLNINLFF